MFTKLFAILSLFLCMFVFSASAEYKDPLHDIQKTRELMIKESNWEKYAEALKKFDNYVERRTENQFPRHFEKYMVGDVKKFIDFLDLDQDGYITREECDTAVVLASYPAETYPYFCDIVFDGKLFDRDGDGMVDPIDVTKKKYNYMQIVYDLMKRRKNVT